MNLMGGKIEIEKNFNLFSTSPFMIVFLEHSMDIFHFFFGFETLKNQSLF